MVSFEKINQNNRHFAVLYTLALEINSLLSPSSQATCIPFRAAFV